MKETKSARAPQAVREYMARLGARGGSVISPAKREAARANLERGRRLKLARAAIRNATPQRRATP